MKCEEIESWMIDYLDNKLDEQHKKEIEKHLETCEKCLDDLRDCQRILKLTDEQHMENPEEMLRVNFFNMLQKEIRKSGAYPKSPAEKPALSWFNNTPFLIAAGIALLICGAFIGMLIHPRFDKSQNMSELDRLQSRLTEMKKNTILTMLTEESSASRLQGLNYAEEIDQPDDKILGALMSTLNRDNNVNVRLAAAYSLSKFTYDRSVCDSLVASLPIQKDPLIQITLINILAGIKEKSALRSIQQIINDKNTIGEVRSVAEKGAAELML